MTVKMIATRNYYHPVEGKEYKVGESFMAEERIANRLERSKRAKRHETKPEPKVMKRPVVETKVMRAAQETPVAAPAPAPVEDPVADMRSSRYRRSDMRSED